MSNGQLISNTVDEAAGTSTWVWEETEPMATYLATLNIGKFTILRDTTASGIPVINGVRPDQLTDHARTRLANIGTIIDFFGTKFGTYPFSSVGAIVDVTNAGYQMETADAAGVHERQRPQRARARARAPVVRRSRRRAPDARRLAERGLRHVRELAVGREHRRHDRAGLVQHQLRARREHDVLEQHRARPGRRQPVPERDRLHARRR